MTEIWHLRCLICQPGTKWNMPKGTHDLVRIQQHLMQDHGCSQQDLIKQSSIVIAPNVYEYRLPNGTPWLYAEKKVTKTVPTDTQNEKSSDD